MGSAGGTITVSRTGLPVDGLQVRIPQNAISSTVAISVSVQSAAALVLPEGVSTPTPLIKVSAPGASLAQPMLIRVLVPEETGSFRYAALWNPVTRKLTPQPTIASNPTSITVAVGEFSTSSAASASMAFPSSSVATEEMLVVLKGLADILILGDFDTGFRPGIDDWDFARQPILDPAIKGRQRRSTLR